ncbi:MAG: hypothetical protein D6776_03615 [Planctomycetota bacterium]|nr:MAG: hypothetical protein D6776_03615 [Planctomycetota bacterium]
MRSLSPSRPSWRAIVAHPPAVAAAVSGADARLCSETSPSREIRLAPTGEERGSKTPEAYRGTSRTASVLATTQVGDQPEIAAGGVSEQSLASARRCATPPARAAGAGRPRAVDASCARPPRHRWWRAALDLAFPPRCLLCRGQLARGRAHDAPPVCRGCRERLLRPARELPPVRLARLPAAAAVRAYACGPLHGEVGTLLRGLKFYRRPACARALGWLLAERVRVLAPRLDALVAVPADPRRRVVRAIAHAEAIARHAAARLAVPLLPGVIERTSAPRLTRLGRRERERIARRCHRAGARRVDGLRIGLVDDVLTTGTTLTVCAEILRQQGAREVVGLCVARRCGVDPLRPPRVYSAARA